MTTSLAAVFTSPGAPLEMQSFPLPTLNGSEALVKIECATICGSDLHSYFGRRHTPIPGILGHEMVGEIVAAGPDGASDYHGVPLVIGDHVTWSMVWSCGKCFYCSRGLRSKCEKLMKFGHEPITPGRELLGGMAEHCYLPEGTAIFRVPKNLPHQVASPANCATATVAAVYRNAGPVAGETIVVHGAGMLGVTACAMAASGGAARVIVIEPDARRRQMALRFGADVAIDSTKDAQVIAAEVKSVTEGRGADVGLEFAGYPESIELGISLLRMGGRFVMAGATFPSRFVQLDGEQLVRRMIRITGVYNYIPEDLEAALEFLSRTVDKFPYTELVGAIFPLRSVNMAIAFAESERPPRVALVP